MSFYRRKVAALLGTVVLAVLVAPSVVARAELPSWNGKYLLVLYADQKTGNSMAARQPQPQSSAEYVLATQCSASKCVASIIDGPRPTNPTIPLPERYTWDGSQWTQMYDWQWDCFVGDGVPKVWRPARSWTSYAPQPDGTLTGTWMTEIYGGPCEGSVMIPVAAFPR